MRRSTLSARPQATFAHNIHPVRARWAALALLAAAAWLAPAREAAALGLREFCYCVPMRDGVCLPTDVYLPRFPKGCYPVVLIRTPDGREAITRLYARFVCSKGYALVVQDVRGSKPGLGDGVLFTQGNADGHDTIRWITSQPWSNGSVATWGASIMGFTENMLAPGAPPALRAQYVVMAFSDMYTQTVYQGGAFRKELVEGWLASRWRGAEMLATLRAHPAYDDFWAVLNPESQAEAVDAPGIFLGGWSDPFVEGTIGSFVAIQNRGGPRARGNCRLVLGPWLHSQISTLVDPRQAGCFPSAANPVPFFQTWAKCLPNCVACEAPVTYYVIGACGEPAAAGNRWRTARNWPPAAAATDFYLGADKKLQPQPPAAPRQFTYRYDPADPAPTLGGRNLNIAAGPMDQQSAESRPDVLVFTSDELAGPVEIAGPVVAFLYVASDRPDTDFTVKLTDVYPDGRSILVVDGILRARFRNGYDKQDFLEPGKVYPIGIDVGSTAYAFNRGHRIRVAVSSSNSPRFEPNPNTGKPAGQSPPQPAANTVHASAEYPSRIVLPVFGGE